MQLLAAADGEFHLDFAILEIHLGGNQGEAFFAGLAVELVDLLAVEQQFALADGQVVLAVAVRVFADVGVDQPRLALFDAGEGVLELDLARAAGLHLGSGEDHAGLEAFHEFVVMAGGTVVADDLEAVGGFGLSGAQNDSPALCSQRGRGARRQ